MQHRLLTALLGVALMSLVGCGGGNSMKKFDVEVVLGPSMVDEATGTIPSIEVDFVGVNESENARWRGYSLSEYFSGSDDLRAGASRTTLSFTSASADPKTLERNDPIWDDWDERQATYLYVLANLPGVMDAAGDQDIRRMILPLAAKRWDTSKIKIEIQRSGLIVRPGPKPE